jgi:hypothetical protein
MCLFFQQGKPHCLESHWRKCAEKAKKRDMSRKTCPCRAKGKPCVATPTFPQGIVWHLKLYCEKNLREKCKMKKLFARIILPLLSVALIAVIALVGCSGETAEPGYVPAGEVVSIGQGETVFRLEVVDGEGYTSAWSVSTDEETVGAALLAVGLIEGEESPFGLMVTTVNGLTADFNADGSWWQFNVDGEMSPLGVDSTYTEHGVTYAFIFTQ